jgi:hypothetical protein
MHSVGAFCEFANSRLTPFAPGWIIHCRPIGWQADRRRENAGAAAILQNVVADDLFAAVIDR